MRQTLSKIIKILDGQPTGKRGQSMVEMALTRPLLILMILGFVEIGFFANDYLILLDAIRSASRYAVNLDPTTWPYPEAHNVNRMDCDVDANAPAGSSIYSQYPGEKLYDPSSPDGPYGQRADPAAIPAGFPIANGPRGWQLMAGHPSLPARSDFYKNTDATYGFFDAVACQVIVSMAPLHLQDYLDPTTHKDLASASDATLPMSKDDIVVSAISYEKMNYNTVGCTGSACAAGPTSHGGYWVTVTGRWPIESRYCKNVGGDSRDPFDYLRSDYNSAWKNGNPGGAKNADGTSLDNQPGNVAPVPKQWEGPVSGLDSNPPVRDPGANPDWRILDASTSATDSQCVRGYMFTGNHQNWDGSKCFGSEFTVQEIEKRLNLNYDATVNLNQNTPNGGMVIVEVFWQYHPLFFGPLFQGFTHANKENDPVMHVWSFYPLPSIEQNPTPKK